MITPRGWIVSAKMYSLVVENGFLYILHTGRAADPTGLFLPSYSRWGIAPKIIQAKYDQRVLPNQKTIESGGPDVFLTGNKGCVKFLLSQVSEVKVEDSTWKGCSLYFLVNGKKYRFIFDRPRMDEVTNFSAQLS